MTRRSAVPIPSNTHFVPLDTEVTLHIERWPGERRPFVLLHGLSSNLRTWQQVGNRLAMAGHAVVSVDQRGHGLSDKPADGYDFATVTADLAALLDALELRQPIIAGQSWGGNVVLEFGARYPGRARGLAFVDGGFLDMQSRSDGDWETTAERLRPPDLDGTPLSALRARIRQFNPDWSEDGIDATLANFEVLADGTARRRLPVDKHMQILRALWEQRPPQLYGLVQEPVLICPADTGDPAWIEAKRAQVAAAHAALPRSEVHWFENTAHDIHVHRPRELADLMLRSLEAGVWHMQD